MESSLDRFGRIVIPKEIRDELGLKAGMVFRIENDANSIYLKPVKSESPLVMKGKVLVHTGKPIGPLEDQLQKQREERMQRIISWRKR